ncbi:MAG: hypothetical protein HY400_01155 [Elusimicrobia bacterium]|nr:hypothetical protein [Elusimicrobiota bacterium]
MIRALAYVAFWGLGMVAVWDDFRFQKVRNQWIVLGLLLSGLGYLSLGIPGVWERIPVSFYWNAGLHVGLCFLAGVCLWYLRIWPAGDAKLYIVLGSLLILAHPDLRGFPSFLFFNILVNIFVSAGLYVVLVLLGEGFVARREFKATLHRLWIRLSDEWPKRHRYVLILWNIFVLFLVLHILRQIFFWPIQGFWGQVSAYFTVYFLWRWLNLMFIRWDVTGISFFIVSGIILPLGFILRWDLMAQFVEGGILSIGFWIFFAVLRLVLDGYLRNARLRKVKPEDLEPGMILSEQTWELLEEDCTRYSDGLSEDEIQVIRKRCEKQGGFKISVYEPRTFAFWVFWGSLWTLVQRQNVAEWLVYYLRYL